MNILPFCSSKTPWLSFMALVCGIFVASTETSQAGLTLTSSSGTISYGVYSTNSNFESPAFVRNMLVYPGGGLPVLQGPLGDSPTQTTHVTTISPYFLSNATTTVGSVNGYVPTSFGTASTELYTATSGQQGGFTTQGGVYWSLRTGVADALTASQEASVSFSNATATYTNNTTHAITITPGAVLSVSGTLGSLDGSSSVAAGLATSISLFGGGVNASTFNLDSIILGSNSQVNIARTGGGANEFASVTVAGNRLTGTGTSLSSAISLSVGESITVSSYLTLISDPNSSIGISTNIPSGVQYIPDFGAFASSPSIVPEPSTIVLLGAGMVLTGLWTRSNRRRVLP